MDHLDIAAQYACLGFKALGLCDYDPAKPFTVYFAPGAAVGALAFTLAVQQLLKPVHRFRLSAHYLTLPRIYVLVFGGVLAVVVASILPNITTLHESPFGYAINWEILAALVFAVSYGAVVIAIVRPVRVGPSELPKFAQQAAKLLSSANEQDHIDFASDLYRSLPILIDQASFLDALPPSTSAFYDFIHRNDLDRAGYAASFLHIVADPNFCETLVKRLPWDVVFMLRAISAEGLYSKHAAQLVRELAHQAILRDDSMMAREVGYHGFGTAPLLSDALFSDAFIIERYNPFDNLLATDQKTITPKLLKRFNSATERCYTTLIDTGQIYHSQATFRIQRFYQSVFFDAAEIQRGESDDTQITFEMHQIVELAIKMAHKLLDSLNLVQYEALYVLDPKKYRADVLETLVEIVFEALAAVSNKFKGFDDPFWITVIQTVQHVYPSFSGVPDGLTPFQQRLALKLIDKLSDNMRGYYPAICRVLLAWVGPYVHAAPQPTRTAFIILKDAVYFELQKLPQLAASKPDKVGHYLPDNVTFDSLTTDLVHTYRSGTPSATRLSSMNLAPISLVAKDIRNTYGVRLAIIDLLKQRSTKLAAQGRAVWGRGLPNRRLTLRPKTVG